jgi:hypothetical protein
MGNGSAVAHQVFADMLPIPRDECMFKDQTIDIQR